MSDSFLPRILAHKSIEVERQEAKIPLEQVRAKIEQAPPVRSFTAALRQRDHVALIAEVKKASPSKGVLRDPFDHFAIAQTYIDNGAAALSVLTDERFFQGSLTYLEGIRTLPAVPPLLRKDFVIGPYQVYEARAYGADALLLIVAALTDEELHALLELTALLGMEALVEVHDEEELQRALHVGAMLVGINNRDLRSFFTSLQVTERLARLLPDGTARPTLVSESGIFQATDVARVRDSGADAVLVGEALITAADTGEQVRELAGVPRQQGVLS